MPVNPSPDIAARTDALTIDDLRARGGLKWTSVPPGAIGAGVAEMDQPLAPAIVDALHEAIDRGLTGYLPPALLAQVADASAHWQTRYGWTVDPADVHPVGSVVTGFRIVLEHLTDPRASVVLPVPAYMPFLTVPATARRRLVTVPMRIADGRYEFDLPAIAAALRPGAVFVLTNPHNPTGRVFTEAELLALAEVVEDAGATVFADEIHAPLTMPGFRHRPYASLSGRTAGHTIARHLRVQGMEHPRPGVRAADSHLGRGPGGLADAGPLYAARRRSPRSARWPPSPPTPAARRTSRRSWTIWRPAATCSPRNWPAGCRRHGCSRSRAPTCAGWTCATCRPTRPRWPTGVGVDGVDGARCGTPGFLRVNLAMPHPLLVEVARRLGRLAA